MKSKLSIFFRKNMIMMFLFVICAFYSFAIGKLPYTVTASLSCDDDNETVSVELSFRNRNEKAVTGFIAIIYISKKSADEMQVFGENNEAYSSYAEKYVIPVDLQQEVDGILPSKCRYMCSVPLDFLYDSENEEEYEIDFIYINQIYYADGEVWKY